MKNIPTNCSFAFATEGELRARRSDILRVRFHHSHQRSNATPGVPRALESKSSDERHFVSTSSTVFQKRLGRIAGAPSYIMYVLQRKLPDMPCMKLSNPKPGHTTGGSGRSSARRDVGAGRGRAARDADGSFGRFA